MSSEHTVKIYFNFYRGENCPPEQQYYAHDLVCLAEGLKALGIPFHSSRNYWRLSPRAGDYLFNYDPAVDPDDCSIVVFSQEWFHNGGVFPENIFRPDRKYRTVYFERSFLDGRYSARPGFRKFDFMFLGQHNNKLNYPANVHPWAFGLSERVLRETGAAPPFDQKEKVLLVNYRHTVHPHTVRVAADRLFLPLIQKIMPITYGIESRDMCPAGDYHSMQWRQTGRRHCPAYYKRLKGAAACACFSGFFIPPFPGTENSLVTRGINCVFKKLSLRSNVVISWDSWRFWESLAAGCVAFHLDFEKYGFSLPVMPENWKHYVGIDLDNVQDAIDRINRDPQILESIAGEGRSWALKNYSPVPVALRFLKTVDPVFRQAVSHDLNKSQQAQ